MNTRKCGSRYEEIAERYLKKQGYKIAERNFLCKVGEIDLIAYDGRTLVFVEVKYRRNPGSGYPEEAVSYAKQKKLSRTADYYCIKNHISERTDRRFDVVAIDGDDIRHHANAFMYCGGR